MSLVFRVCLMKFLKVLIRCDLMLMLELVWVLLRYLVL